MPKYMIRHSDDIRMYWDIFIIILTLYNCIAIPFETSFSPEMPVVVVILEVFFDIIFGLDILIALRTTYVDMASGIEVVQPK